MVELIDRGSVRILCGDLSKLSQEETLKLIREAGAICFQKESKRSPENFFRMLIKKEHFSVIEHSGFCAEIRVLHKGSSAQIDKTQFGLDLFLSDNLFGITKRSHSLIVSGNVRMGREAKIRNLHAAPAVLFLYNALSEEYPILYPLTKDNRRTEDFGVEVVLNPRLKNKEEMLAHRRVTVEIKNCSRAALDEILRHRTSSPSVMSTRRADLSHQMSFVSSLDEETLHGLRRLTIDEPRMMGCSSMNNPRIVEQQSGGPEIPELEYYMSPAQLAALNQAMCASLQQDGVSRDKARQWLPIGMGSHATITATLGAWRHFFYQRTAKAAHEEVIDLAVELLQEFQERFSPNFDDFEIAPDNKSAKYIGDDHLV